MSEALLKNVQELHLTKGFTFGMASLSKSCRRLETHTYKEQEMVAWYEEDD